VFEFRKFVLMARSTKKVGTIEDFYKGKNFWMPDNLQKDPGHINERTFEEINSDYIHKYDLLRKLVFEFLHFAILLKHTAWTVAEIAYALGFAEATHFNNFFKKHVQLSPLKFRND
jgi:hypothetical protein